ncbi:unnamed protein product [Fusarium venenatum]|uniref:Uncharacterized protein n=1 Tax=Fusarium venenatum TaxID=56646 RepID=A0A2L2U459_9HYPO|nr:uncharacterized protein FVRRES_09842 [Fusarium venenatum]CEI69765.1 unnamed protein product [Fusarium venenatum]
MPRVGENRFGGENDERLENGEELEIAATERQNLQSPAVSGGLDVIKPKLSGQRTAASPQVRRSRRNKIPQNP